MGETRLGVNITVIGVGGAGCNAVNMMSNDRNKDAESVFTSVNIIAANTDVQDLESSKADVKVQLGPERTRGNGAGAKPEVGRESAEESRQEILEAIDQTDILFITAGMGGGTGTGAAPIIAELARNDNILTVGVVTLPFKFEGKRKMKIAMQGIDALKEQVDTLLLIPNQRLEEAAAADLTMMEAFELSNNVLLDTVKGITLLIREKGLINVDFEDVRTTMTQMGVAKIGFGSATGPNAPMQALEDALNNELLSDVSITGSERALLYFRGNGLRMNELTAAGNHISEILHEDVEFIWGASDNGSEKDDRVSVFLIASAKMVEKKNEARGITFDVSQEQPEQTGLFDESKKKEIKEIANIIKEKSVEVTVEQSEPEVEIVDDDLDDYAAPAASHEPQIAPQSSTNNLDELRSVPAYLRRNKK